MRIAVPFRILLPLLLLVPVLPAGAQPVRLVKNLYPDDGYSRRDIFSFPEHRFLAVGEKAFFVTGGDIGVTDGTAAGTRLLYHDPGDCFGGPQLLGTARNLVFWTGCSIDDVKVLWRSDGTIAGTFQLTSVSQVRVEFYPPFPGDLPDDPTYASASGIFYFTGCDGSQCSLWRTDGTRQGTRAAVEPGSRPAAGAGGRIFFVGSDKDFNRVLAVTNGTAAGTVHLKSFNGYPPRRFTLVGGKMFFLGGEDEEELWVSDGTPAGTRAVSRFLPTEPFEETHWLKAIGNRVYFLADDSVHGAELWRSDGTEAGTVRVSEIAHDTPFSETLRPSHVEEATGGRVVFLATDGLGSYKLWASSGKPESTTLLKDVCPLDCGDGHRGFNSTVDLARTSTGRVIFKRRAEGSVSEAWSTDGTLTGTVQLAQDIVDKPYSLQGRTFFATSSQIWLSDGTLAGTTAFGDLPPRSYLSSPNLFMASGRVLFQARNELYGFDLWASDGRPGGTELLADFDPQDRKGSSPGGLTELGGQLFFSATTPGPTSGSPFGGIRTLWRSGGSAETTLPLPGAPTTPVPGCNTQPQLNLFRVGSRMFFSGPGSQCNTETLWATDGTPEGTRPLGIDPLEKVVFQGQIFFLESSFSEPAALWKNDGTPGGTVKVFDLPAGAQRPSGLTPVGSELYFLASNAEGTSQVWRTDGTLAGTRQITSFTEDDEIGISPQFVRAGAFVFFPTGDSFSGPRSLWRTDGTPGGTVQVTDTLGHDGSPRDLTAFKGNLFFFQDGELFRSDGRPGGTVRLRSFPGDAYFRVEHQPVVSGDHLFFVVYDPVYGTELWKTDGTAAGTNLVRDISPGESSSWPQLFTAAGNRLFFQANDGAHGYELWQSDGTAAGTRLVQDLNPGFASSYPFMAPVGNRLFISADDGSIGRELWVLPLGPTGPCQPSPTALCLSGGRFRVEIQWKTLPSGQTGVARAVSLSPDAGYFWFSDPAKVETFVKVLDGRGSNGHHWVFYGSLSNVEYSLTVTDTQTGLTRRYFNHQGYLASVGDRHAFGPQGATAVKELAAPAGAGPFLVSERFEPMAAARCVPSAGRLCLNNGRFAVEARWKISGRQGTGKAVSINGDTGYFWFSQAANVETVVRIEDGRQSNGRFWFLSASLSDAEYEITVTDTVTRKVKTYKNPSGRFASVRDTAAF